MQVHEFCRYDASTPEKTLDGRWVYQKGLNKKRRTSDGIIHFTLFYWIDLFGKHEKR
jgi:hypothetical protein